MIETRRAIGERDAPRRAAVLASALMAAAWLATAEVAARAQSVDRARPCTLVIGVPGGARTDRVDTARTGLSRTALPMSGLHVEWRATAGAPLEHAPLVDARGSTYVVSARGEAVAIGREGAERWRVPTNASDPGAAALLSDDTVVVVDGAGDAIGIRDGVVRWRSHVGVADSARPGPLPLDDGGVVVAVGRDLALLDADGHERARTVLSEPATTPLLLALGRVVLVAASGTVWMWTPGTPEALPVATFGSPIAGGAALANDHTLVAVGAGQRSIASIDLVRGGGAHVPRAVAPGGLWLGPPTLRGDATTLPLVGFTSEIAVTVDASGQELGRALMAGHLAASPADAGAGGAIGLVAPLLVDLAGTIVFATLDGSVGVAAADGSVERLGEVCPRPGGPLSAPITNPGVVAGLAPLAPGAFVVGCRSGILVAIDGAASTSNGGKTRPSTL